MKLSVCMMVRNEEKNLERCLASFMKVDGFCDELIVVDTGSEDKTPEIARKFGADLKFSFWRDDFSWMRNKSISYATGDWILIVDADEELVGDLMALKKEIAKEKDYNALTITLHDIVKGQRVNEFATPRIFRKGKVRYHSIVHNSPVISGGNRAKMSESEVILRHYGYDLTPEEAQRKYELRLRLLKKRLETNPEDFDSYFYLAQTYGSGGKLDEAQKAAEIYVKHRDKIRRFNTSIYSLLAEIYAIKEEKIALEWVFVEARSAIPLDVDMAWIYFQWALKDGDMHAVLNSAANYLDCYRKFNTKESVEERGTKFVFNYSAEKYATALQVSCLNLLKMGMDQLHEFGELSTQHPEEIKPGDLQEALLNIGINWNHNTTQPEEGDQQWARQKMQ